MLTYKRSAIMWLCILSTLIVSASAQVKPDEIPNPQLKTDEAEFLPQLLSLKQSIQEYTFSYPLRLCSCTEVKTALKGKAADRGIEFVYFKQSELLKISGIYDVSYSTRSLTQNERAAHTLEQVVVPILQMTLKQFSKNRPGDGVGIEIVYGARDQNLAYDYEGREVITAIFTWQDAFAYIESQSGSVRQSVLDRSEVYVDGKAYGVSLSQRNSLPIDSLQRSVPRHLRSSLQIATSALPEGPTIPKSASIVPPSKGIHSADGSESMPSESFPKKLERQVELDPFTKQNKQLNIALSSSPNSLHVDARNPSSFVNVGGQVVLYLNLLNPLSYAKRTASIYKQSAEGFDLVIAPELKELLRLVPSDAQYDLLQITLVGSHAADERGSEDIEYVCPKDQTMLLAEDKISSQDLIDQCRVIVNSVRIRVNLESVE